MGRYRPSAERATAFAEKYSGKKTCYSYEALVTDTEVDAVYVATPHRYHFEQYINNSPYAVMVCRCEDALVLCPKQSPRRLGDCFAAKTKCAARNDITFW